MWKILLTFIIYQIRCLTIFKIILKLCNYLYYEFHNNKINSRGTIKNTHVKYNLEKFVS